MRPITITLTTTKLIVLLIAVAALMVVVMWSSTIRPAAAQPYCGHEFCDWYQHCIWEFWGWDSSDGWVLVNTDGDC